MPLEQLVTTDWLAGEMGASDLRIIDATWFLPGSERNAQAEYEQAHIPGAVFMDLNDIVDSNHSAPNMVPPPEKFASRMQKLGVGDGSRIVIYDNSPLKSAARAWFLFTIFGAHDVAILDGGFAKWTAEGRETESGQRERRHRHFTAWIDRDSLRSKDDVLANIESGKEQLVDARNAERFAGATPEPREGMAAGHIPGSINLPYSELFDEKSGLWKRDADLESVFANAGVDMNRPFVGTCGSGTTAASLLFGLALLGKKDIALYDGSWAEWGMDPDVPKQLGK